MLVCDSEEEEEEERCLCVMGERCLCVMVRRRRDACV